MTERVTPAASVVTDENAPPGTISKATFSGFPGATLNLEYFDSDKLGTFTR